jgi:hypothetical protein
MSQSEADPGSFGACHPVHSLSPLRPFGVGIAMNKDRGDKQQAGDNEAP